MTTVDELNNFMAEKVMGWHKGMSMDGKTFSRGSWKDGSGFVNWQFSWNPTEDIAQAMVCAEKSGIYINVEMNADIDINGKPHLVNVEYECLDKFVALDELPKAICEAIREAVEK